MKELVSNHVGTSFYYVKYSNPIASKHHFDIITKKGE